MKASLYFLILAAAALVSVCCKKSGNTPPYRIEGIERIDNYDRTWLLNLPPGYYNNDSMMPLIIALHGTGGSGAQFEKDYAFTTRANREGFAVLYPDGVRKQDGRLGIRTWNAGSCCDYASYSNVNDTKFISILIDELSEQFRINRRRVYIAGMSNGAMMAYRLAAELPEKIAAIAAVSGMMVYPTDPVKAAMVPVLHIHSLADTKVPFNGGIGLGGHEFPVAMDGIYYRAVSNGCDTNALIQQFDGYLKKNWRDLNGVSLVECYLTEDGGHAWPGGAIARRGADTPSTKVNANDLIWEFFKRFTR